MKMFKTFFYNAPFEALQASETRTFVIQAQSDADFEIQKLMSNAVASLTNSNPVSTLEGLHFTGILVQVIEESSGLQWFNEPTSMPNVFGTATTPVILPQTKILPASASLQVTVTNLYTAVNFDLVYLTFFGRKLYY